MQKKKKKKQFYSILTMFPYKHARTLQVPPAVLFALLVGRAWALICHPDQDANAFSDCWATASWRFKQLKKSPSPEMTHTSDASVRWRQLPLASKLHNVLLEQNVQECLWSDYDPVCLAMHQAEI